MPSGFREWWHPFVPMELKDVTREWVQEVLRDAGEVRSVKVQWLSEGDSAAGGATGAKLFKVTASLRDGEPLSMVYKATASTYYGEISWGERAMFAIMEPSIHNALAMGHNLPFNEWAYYDAFLLRQTLQPALPGPRVYAAPRRGNPVSRLGLFTMRWYRDCANGLLMEDLTSCGFHGFGPMVDVGTNVAMAAVVDLARFHAGHWGKPYVRRRGVPAPMAHWFGLNDRALGARLERTTDGGLLRSLLAARSQGQLLRCNLPARVPRPDLLQPGKVRNSLPELFEPEQGPFFTALRALETSLSVLVRRVWRLAARRETLLMGDAHSGNIFAREAPTEVRWIDFQHWGSGSVSMELAYFFMGAVDAVPGRDDELLRAYHAEFARGCSGLELGELRADTAAAMLVLAASALFHYPTNSWPGGTGIVQCLVDPQNLPPPAIPGRIREAEKQFRMVYRMIQRIPLVLSDASHPLTREVLARHDEVLRSRKSAPRSRL